MERLYELASDLYGFHPWRALDESQLIITRDSATGQLCYCSVMGALGEVYAMHAYLGDEGFRAFRKIEAEEFADPVEFLASVRSLYVEFAPRAELEPQDRQLLAALNHPQGRGLASPIFRSIRPGFHPWFVSAEEARTLSECIRAVIVICGAVASAKSVKFWEQAGTYPMVTRVDGVEPRYRIDLVKSVLPPEPAMEPARLSEETLRALRGQDYAVRGAMELDYIFSGAQVGKKNERKAWVCIALAVDGETGIVCAMEAIDAAIAPGEALARAFLKAIQASRAMPSQVRVRNQRFRDSIAPLMQSFDVKLSVAARLRAADEARAHLLEFLRGGG